MSKKFTILIVDDEKSNIEYLSLLLKERYIIKAAFSGEQALKVVQNVSVDLILLDVQMPYMDGFEVIKKLKKFNTIEDIPVIFLTASKEEAVMVEGFSLGARDFITKPFNNQELLVRINNHLQIYALQSETLQQKIFLDLVINSQSSLIILTDMVKVKFANNATLNFFGYESLVSLSNAIECISDVFEKDENYFHADKVAKNSNWIETLQKLPNDQKVVLLHSKRHNQTKAFHIEVNGFKHEKYFIITLSDINETMVKKLEYEWKSIHDSLTQAPNREYFRQHIDTIIKENTQAHNETTIVMVDIDYFKKINDTYGHKVGDEVLSHLVRIITEKLLANEIIVRWGGEEFLLVLSAIDEAQLTQRLESIRILISNELFPCAEKITISLGASFKHSDERVDDTIIRADDALYRSKEGGRDRVTLL